MRDTIHCTEMLNTAPQSGSTPGQNPTMNLPAVLPLVYCTHIHFLCDISAPFFGSFGSPLHPPSLQGLAAVSEDERGPGTKESAAGMQGTEL